MPLSALMLLEFMQLQPGQWAILNAANGAVGKSFAMIAAARGINTISLVRRAEAVQELTDLGIKHAMIFPIKLERRESLNSLAKLKSVPL